MTPILRIFGKYLLVSLLLWPIQSSAWGEKGHRLIADLALIKLNPTARGKLNELLSRAESSELAELAFWADDYRHRPEGRPTASWHYVNLPRTPSCQYRPARDCPDGQCLPAALLSQWQLLADHRTPQPQRLRALKFVIHLVADLHQPLHVGYADDRGGNLYQVQVDKRGSNLHQIWDSTLLKYPKLSYQDYLTRLSNSAEISAPIVQPEQVQKHIQIWLEQSCHIIQANRIYPASRNINNAYLKQHSKIVEQQLNKAGLRLAQLINSALSATN